MTIRIDRTREDNVNLAPSWLSSVLHPAGDHQALPYHHPPGPGRPGDPHRPALRPEPVGFLLLRNRPDRNPTCFSKSGAVRGTSDRRGHPAARRSVCCPPTTGSGGAGRHQRCCGRSACRQRPRDSAGRHRSRPAQFRSSHARGTQPGGCRPAIRHVLRSHGGQRCQPGGRGYLRRSGCADREHGG